MAWFNDLSKTICPSQMRHRSRQCPPFPVPDGYYTKGNKDIKRRITPNYIARLLYIFSLNKSYKTLPETSKLEFFYNGKRLLTNKKWKA